MYRLIISWICWVRILGQSRPNIVIFMVDDMGIGDIPCYGNTSVPMENVKSLCTNGAVFSHHTTVATICTPSRAAFQTGRYPVRMGLAGQENTPPVNIFTAGTDGLPRNETTFGKLAQRAGYFTGYVGKWHLGLNENWHDDMLHGPLGHGYDYFFGLPYTLVEEFDNTDGFFTLNRFSLKYFVAMMALLAPLRLFLNRWTFFLVCIMQASLAWFLLEHFSIIHQENWWGRSPFMYKFLNSYLMEDRDVVEKPILLHPLALRLAKKSMDFVERRAKDRSASPFLLMHAFAHVHDPLHTSWEFSGSSVEHGKYGDALIETDHCVGLIMDKLRELNILENTLVYFTSDHGANIQLGKHGGFNGPYRGGKGNGALEGGMRIPGIIQWSEVVQPGMRISEPTSFLDILPTVAELAGADTTNLHLDGQSLLPLLKGEQPSQQTKFLHHFCDSEIFASRFKYADTVYKFIFREPKLDHSGLCSGGSGALCKCYGEEILTYDPPLLYRIDEEPGERLMVGHNSILYSVLHGIITTEKERLTKELDDTKMTSQFADKSRVLPKPWLQPAYFSIQYKEQN